MVKNKHFSLLLASSLLGTALLTGCGAGNQATPASSPANNNAEAPATTAPKTAAEEKVIQNVWGEAKVKGTPSKVVALDFFIVDILVSLGVTPTGIAGTGDTRVPYYLKDKVRTFTDVGERKEPNLEVMTSIKPDLIIANPERAKTIKGELEKIGTSIALNDKSYKAILDDVDLLGDVFSKQTEAKKVREDLENKIKTTKEKVKGNPSVLVLGAFDDEISVWIKDSFVGSLLGDAGVNYMFDGPKESTEGKADIATLTVERLAELNPDYLFVYGTSVAKLKENPVFKNLKAVKENHFMEVKQDLWARARGPIAAGLILDEAVSLLGSASK